ncbi:cache domain-containing protein [Uliginosibacterium sp. sgz301328]|uniref:cache domain-containing protein n=1 Tax=Uliginosibacterium sp. sgz301328 TaxID=3243764 RepID=UPI00359D84D7
MHLRFKFALFAILPLLLAITAIAAVVRIQAESLAEAEARVVEPVLLSARKAELTHYVSLALLAIEPMRKRGDEAAAREALATLARMEFGEDGYYFVYDSKGRNLMHPRQPELVGQNLWNMHDANGVPVIQNLITAASHGGGFVEYLWPRPTMKRQERKLGYVVTVPEWNWVLGTGIYMNDLEDARKRIDEEATRAIRRTMTIIVVIAVFATLMVATAGYAVNLTERRDAEAKMRALAHQVVASQEKERARVARELHDGVSQWLVSVKFMLESALSRLRSEAGGADAPLERGVSGVNDVLREIRRISHGLRPAMLDDLGLVPALSQVLNEFSRRTGVATHLEAPETLIIPDAVATALFRVTQEALTNAERHAGATRIDVSLRAHRNLVLSVSDNGQGFDVDRVSATTREGLGLSSMRERVETLGGFFSLQSGPSGTTIVATLPAASLRA